MTYTRADALQRLLRSYKPFYNITEFEEEQKPLTALCEFFEHSQKYMLSKKAEIWATSSEEFLYLFDTPHLTQELYNECMKKALEDGKKRMNIGPGHMYSWITPVFICDICDEDARKTLRKSRYYKSFHFSLHGWMDYHAAVVELSTDRIDCNSAGKSTAKILKKVLYQKKKKRRGSL